MEPILLPPFSPSHRRVLDEYPPDIAGSLGYLHARRAAACTKSICARIVRRRPDTLR